MGKPKLQLHWCSMVCCPSRPMQMIGICINRAYMIMKPASMRGSTMGWLSLGLVQTPPLHIGPSETVGELVGVRRATFAWFVAKACVVYRNVLLQQLVSLLMTAGQNLPSSLVQTAVSPRTSLWRQIVTTSARTILAGILGQNQDHTVDAMMGMAANHILSAMMMSTWWSEQVVL